MEGKAVISYGLARNYREQLQKEIDDSANGLPLSRSGAAGAAKKIASLRCRANTLLGWRRDAEAKKIDALESGLSRICGIITGAVETVGESVAAVAESVSLVADSVAVMHTDLRSLMRGDVVLDDTTSLQEQRVACELALVVMKARKNKIVTLQKEQKAQAKAAAPPKVPRATTPRAKRCKIEAAEVAVPEAAVPEASAPEAAVPEASAPEASAPEESAPEAAVPTPVYMYELNGHKTWESQFEADAKNGSDLSPLEQLAEEGMRRKFLNQKIKTMVGAATHLRDDLQFALYAVNCRRECLVRVLPADVRNQYMHDLEQNSV
jgi:hypothetical protein